MYITLSFKTLWYKKIKPKKTYFGMIWNYDHFSKQIANFSKCTHLEKIQRYSTNIDTKCNVLGKIWIFSVTCYKEFH
jgi:hypothetical protein